MLLPLLVGALVPSGSIWWEWWDTGEQCVGMKDGESSDWTDDGHCMQGDSLKEKDPLRVMSEGGDVRLHCSGVGSASLAKDDDITIEWYNSTDGSCEGSPWNEVVVNSSVCGPGPILRNLRVHCTRCKWMFKNASAPPYFLQASGVIVFLLVCIAFNLIFQSKLDHCAKVLPPRIFPCLFRQHPSVGRPCIEVNALVQLTEAEMHYHPGGIQASSTPEPPASPYSSEFPSPIADFEKPERFVAAGVASPHRTSPSLSPAATPAHGVPSDAGWRGGGGGAPEQSSANNLATPREAGTPRVEDARRTAAAASDSDEPNPPGEPRGRRHYCRRSSSPAFGATVSEAGTGDDRGSDDDDEAGEKLLPKRSAALRKGSSDLSKEDPPPVARRKELAREMDLATRRGSLARNARRPDRTGSKRDSILFETAGPPVTIGCRSKSFSIPATQSIQGHPASSVEPPHRRSRRRTAASTQADPQSPAFSARHGKQGRSYSKAASQSPPHKAASASRSLLLPPSPQAPERPESPTVVDLYYEHCASQPGYRVPAFPAGVDERQPRAAPSSSDHHPSSPQAPEGPEFPTVVDSYYEHCASQPGYRVPASRQLPAGVDERQPRVAPSSSSDAVEGACCRQLPLFPPARGWGEDGLGGARGAGRAGGETCRPWPAAQVCGRRRDAAPVKLRGHAPALGGEALAAAVDPSSVERRRPASGRPPAAALVPSSEYSLSPPSNARSRCLLAPGSRPVSLRPGPTGFGRTGLPFAQLSSSAELPSDFPPCEQLGRERPPEAPGGPERLRTGPLLGESRVSVPSGGPARPPPAAAAAAARGETPEAAPGERSCSPPRRRARAPGESPRRLPAGGAFETAPCKSCCVRRTVLASGETFEAAPCECSHIRRRTLVSSEATRRSPPSETFDTAPCNSCCIRSTTPASGETFDTASCKGFCIRRTTPASGETFDTASCKSCCIRSTTPASGETFDTAPCECSRTRRRTLVPSEATPGAAFESAPRARSRSEPPPGENPLILPAGTGAPARLPPASRRPRASSGKTRPAVRGQGRRRRSWCRGSGIATQGCATRQFNHSSDGSCKAVPQGIATQGCATRQFNHSSDGSCCEAVPQQRVSLRDCLECRAPCPLRADAPLSPASSSDSCVSVYPATAGGTTPGAAASAAGFANPSCECRANTVGSPAFSGGDLPREAAGRGRCRGSADSVWVPVEGGYAEHGTTNNSAPDTALLETIAPPRGRAPFSRDSSTMLLPVDTPLTSSTHPLSSSTLPPAAGGFETLKTGCPYCGCPVVHLCSNWIKLAAKGTFGMVGKVVECGTHTVVVQFTRPEIVLPIPFNRQRGEEFGDDADDLFLHSICEIVGYSVLREGRDGCRVVELAGDVFATLQHSQVAWLAACPEFARVVQRPCLMCPPSRWRPWYGKFELCVGEVAGAVLDHHDTKLVFLHVRFRASETLILPFDAFYPATEEEYESECLLVPQTMERRIMMAALIASSPPLLSVKALFLIMYFVYSVKTVASSGHQGRASHHGYWEAYEECFFKLFNSGFPSLMADCVTLTAYIAFTFTPTPRGFVRGLGVPYTFILVASWVIALPGALTHALPMMLVYSWLWIAPSFILFFAVRLLVHFRPIPPPISLEQSYSMSFVWTYHKPYILRAAFYYLFFRIFAEILFIIFLQTNYNYGVMLYDGRKYLDIIADEYNSRDFRCIVERSLQLASFLT
ncbi:hypothetical protein DIPPA_01047 [Diplonema papillatum]|nr:hypothetical protein DIPPA_01047 [Diplonema papillatum]